MTVCCHRDVNNNNVDNAIHCCAGKSGKGKVHRGSLAARVAAATQQRQKLEAILQQDRENLIMEQSQHAGSPHAELRESQVQDVVRLQPLMLGPQACTPALCLPVDCFGSLLHVPGAGHLSWALACLTVLLQSTVMAFMETNTDAHKLQQQGSSNTRAGPLQHLLPHIAGCKRISIGIMISLNIM